MLMSRKSDLQGCVKFLAQRRFSLIVGARSPRPTLTPHRRGEVSSPATRTHRRGLISSPTTRTHRRGNLVSTPATRTHRRGLVSTPDTRTPSLGHGLHARHTPIVGARSPRPPHAPIVYKESPNAVSQLLFNTIKQ